MTSWFWAFQATLWGSAGVPRAARILTASIKSKDLHSRAVATEMPCSVKNMIILGLH